MTTRSRGAAKTSTSVLGPSDEAREQVIHATCVAIGGAGILLRGPSGAGKSDLALRLISQSVSDLGTGTGLLGSLSARLVADDQVIVCNCDGKLQARPPAAIAGKLEVRGVGIVQLPYLPEIAIALVVDLVPITSIVRLPELGQTIEINNVVIPVLAVAPFEASAPAKIALALANLRSIS